MDTWKEVKHGKSNSRQNGQNDDQNDGKNIGYNDNQWNQNNGQRNQNNGQWTQNNGQRNQNNGQRTQNNGQWIQNNGQPVYNNQRNQNNSNRGNQQSYNNQRNGQQNKNNSYHNNKSSGYNKPKTPFQIDNDISESVFACLKYDVDTAIIKLNEIGCCKESIHMMIFHCLIKFMDKVEQLSILRKITISHDDVKYGNPWKILGEKSLCDHNVFDGIANFLHSCKFSIEKKKGDDKSPFDFFYNNTFIEKEERQYRILKVSEVNNYEIDDPVIAVILECDFDTIVMNLNKFGNNDEAKQMGIFISLIKLVEKPEQLPIFKEIKIPRHVKNSETKLYTPWHIFAHKESCDSCVISEIAKIIHHNDYSIFDINKHKETALQSVFTKKETSDEEKKFRFKLISEISDKQISKICKSILNKGCDGNIERLKFAICRNYDIALFSMAHNIITTKSFTKKLLEIDSRISQKVNLIVEAFSGSDTSFKNQKFNDSSLCTFFEENENKLPASNELIYELVRVAETITFTDESENKCFNLQSLGSLIGSLANSNFALDLYNNFIFNCLTLKPTDYFADINDEERIKMAIRAVYHAKKMTTEMIIAFREFPKISGSITFAIDTLLSENKEKLIETTKTKQFVIKVEETSKTIISDKTTQEKSRKVCIEIRETSKTGQQNFPAKLIIHEKTEKQTPPINEKNEKQTQSANGKIDVDKLIFFNSLTTSHFDDVIDDLVVDFEKILLENPNQRQDIINKAIYCLLNKITPKIFKHTGDIMKQILTVINPHEILSQENYFNEEIMPDVVMDFPLAKNTWVEILKILKNS